MSERGRRRARGVEGVTGRGRGAAAIVGKVARATARRGAGAERGAPARSRRRLPAGAARPPARARGSAVSLVPRPREDRATASATSTRWAADSSTSSDAGGPSPRGIAVRPREADEAEVREALGRQRVDQPLRDARLTEEPCVGACRRHVHLATPRSKRTAPRRVRVEAGAEPAEIVALGLERAQRRRQVLGADHLDPRRGRQRRARATSLRVSVISPGRRRPGTPRCHPAPRGRRCAGGARPSATRARVPRGRDPRAGTPRRADPSGAARASGCRRAPRRPRERGRARRSCTMSRPSSLSRRAVRNPSRRRTTAPSASRDGNADESVGYGFLDASSP